MNQESDHRQIRKYLAAFADGELDVEQNLKVLEHMTMRPDATRRVMHQQQLRQAVDRAVREHTPPTPSGLRERIEEAAAVAETTPAEKAPRGVGVVGWIQRLSPLAAAALLAISLLLLWEVVELRGGPQDSENGVIPASQVQRFARRHVSCSRMRAALSDSTSFPTDLQELPVALAEYFGVDAPAPDLSGLGYQFHGAGPCRIPGTRSAHLIYRAEPETGRNDSLSLWMRTYAGEPAIEEGKVYTAAGSESAHPIVLWRRGGLIYYLVGDSMQSVHAAEDLVLASAH